jgi:gamma-glutamylcyclotransferase (GGCT)/AIG2-like uncharacterized protein YtfP
MAGYTTDQQMTHHRVLALETADLAELLQVFVYGTLKPGERSFEHYCKPFLLTQQQAQTPGRIYHLPVGYPAMTLESGWVKGVLMTFNSERVFDPMDRLEAYYPDRPEESDYLRIRRPIYSLEQVPLVEAWVYVMMPEKVLAMGGEWLPDGLWTGAMSLH